MLKKLLTTILILLICFPLSTYAKKPSIDAIIIEETAEDWLYLVATPVVANLWHHSGPLLVPISFSDNPQKETKFLRRIVKNKCLLLKSSQGRLKELRGLNMETIRIGFDGTKAAISLAQRFWNKSEAVVIAPIEQQEAMLQASNLATHLKAPLIPIYSDINDGSRITRSLFKSMLTRLKIKKVYATVDNLSNIPKGLRVLHEKVSLLDLPTTQNLIVHTIGHRSVKNVILTRIHEEDSWRSTWVTPYLSFIRKSPIVVTKSRSAKKAEKLVYRFIKSFQIHPRSLTIIGDYHSIGTRVIDDPKILGEYKVDVEPCAMFESGKAYALAVGRIPYGYMGDAARIINRTIAREQLLDTEKRVLMVANPPSDGMLPLAETVSRATSEEFKNFDIPVDEYYQIESNYPTVLNAADKSHFIIYQGHIVDQQIFPDPNDFEKGEVPQNLKRNLTGLPLVILQSCSSLDEATARQIFGAGAVGYIGSVTSIHSASGSTFVKALVNPLLYKKGYTIGQALRNARNYFLCLAELKNKRGHTQTAKSRRVALSFRLWGDPEYVPFAKSKKSQKKPIKAKFTSKNAIKITLPKHRLNKSTTPEYYAQIFPQSSLAGIVKRIKKKTYRKISPFYFFRLRIPKKFDFENAKELWRGIDKRYRSVFLIDRYSRHMYVLYFPKKERKKKKIILKFYKSKEHKEEVYRKKKEQKLKEQKSKVAAKEPQTKNVKTKKK